MNNDDRRLFSAKRLSPQERAKLFVIFQETLSVRATAKRSGVHIKTVRRACRLDRWMDRLKEIDKRVQNSVDKRITNRRLRNVQVLDKAIENIEEQLNTQNIELDPRGLARLVVAQDFLIARGAADEAQTDQSPETQRALELLSAIGIEGLKEIGNQLADQFIPDQSNKPSTEIAIRDVSGNAVVDANYDIITEADRKPQNQELRKKKKKHKNL